METQKTKIGNSTAEMITREIGNGDEAIYKTVEHMKRLSLRDSKDENVIKLAEKIKSSCKDEVCSAFAAFFEVSKQVKYMYDWKQVTKFKDVSNPKSTEFIIAPKYYAKGEGKYGDCDDLSTYLSSILTSLGIKNNLVIIAHSGSKEYSHVYNEAVLETIDLIVPMDLVKKGKRGEPVIGWAKECNRIKVFKVF